MIFLVKFSTRLFMVHDLVIGLVSFNGPLGHFYVLYIFRHLEHSYQSQVIYDLLALLGPLVVRLDVVRFFVFKGLYKLKS